MKYLECWSEWNPKHLLMSKEYVDSNLGQLLRMFPQDSELSDEAKYNFLVKFFSEDPDRINTYSVYSVGKPNQMSVPSLMNIVGVVKYR